MEPYGWVVCWCHFGFSGPLWTGLCYRKQTQAHSRASWVQRDAVMWFYGRLFLHWQQPHQACDPRSRFGMLWICVYSSLSQLLPRICTHKCCPRTTFHNQLYMKEMWGEVWGKWWLHKILAASLLWPSKYIKISHFRAVIMMLSNIQQLDEEEKCRLI